MRNFNKYFTFGRSSVCILLIIILSSGCGYLIYHLDEHYTAYIKGNILVRGRRAGNSKNGIFYDFIIYCNKETYKPDVNKFTIKLSNSHILSSENFIYAYISSIPNAKHWKKKGGINGFFFDGYMFEFKNKRLFYFQTREHVDGKQYTPMIGNKDGTKFYKFPISQKDLESILGAPDKYENNLYL